LLKRRNPMMAHDLSGRLDAGAKAKALNKLLIDILQWL
jgi:hypothetical protein